jgi:hypothetical protein
LAGLRKPYPPTPINYPDWNDLVDYLGGTTTDTQIDSTKILLAQAGSLLSTWRHASDLSKIDAAKLLGNIAAAQMQTNILAALAASGGITNTHVAADAGIAKSKISTGGTWALADLPQPPSCYAYNNANQSIANAAWTTLAFNSEKFDTDGMHDLVTNNHRLTCVTTGKYIACAGLKFFGNAAGVRILSLNVNGARSFGYVDTLPNANDVTGMNATIIVHLVAGDILTVDVWQNSGGALNVITEGSATPFLSAIRVGS